jgi:hypothetical protein
LPLQALKTPHAADSSQSYLRLFVFGGFFLAQDSQSTTVSSTPESRLLGKIVNIHGGIGYIVVPDAAKPMRHRYVFRLQKGESFPPGSMVSFSPEITEGRTYGKAINVVVAIAAPEAAASAKSTTKSREAAKQRKSGNAPGQNSGQRVRCGR